uniref:Uncharacterized protein n=1 Tax=Alexandrium monilatum TaxID=311494 RepID=A0A7S4R278_9DINO
MASPPTPTVAHFAAVGLFIQIIHRWDLHSAETDSERVIALRAHTGQIGLHLRNTVEDFRRLGHAQVRPLRSRGCSIGDFPGYTFHSWDAIGTSDAAGHAQVRPCGWRGGLGA